MPKKPEIDKEMFKRSVLYNVKTLYRKTLEEATDQQKFQAVAYAVKDAIVDNWLKTQAAYDEKDPKIVYYMSMEFLMGRALGNNMINLMAYKEFAEALEELGLDINVIEDQEPDAALGNGGLGRLAACFLDSLASLGYAAYGCGIRYRYGMFKQEIKDGYQKEVPDDWLRVKDTAAHVARQGQLGGRDQHDLHPGIARERRDQRVDGAAVLQIAAEADGQPVDTAVLTQNGKEVGQGLGRVGVAAVARVDDRHGRILGGDEGGALLRVAHGNDIGIRRDHAGGIGNALALLCRG